MKKISKIKAQTPAKGILLKNEWGFAKQYKAVCMCQDNDCSHTVDIEADDTGVTVTVYTTTKTNFWSKTRWKNIWELLTKGFIKSEASIIMDRQTALNYATVLTQSVKDCETIWNKKYVKNQSR